MRNLNLEMLRRVAVSARAAASGAGHSELSIAISEEKNVYEAVMKLIAAKADGKWAWSMKLLRVDCTVGVSSGRLFVQMGARRDKQSDSGRVSQDVRIDVRLG